MRPFQKVVLGLGLALSAAGCSDYLTAPNVTKDPTKATQVLRAGPLYTGVQQAGPPQREGQLARFATLYTQQTSGFSRQQIAFDLYLAKPLDTDTYFGAIYGSSNVLTGGGGLLDLHKLQQIARRLNDSLYIGIAKVYEAMYIGLAADMFGDIPYREAADSTILTPHFEPQLQVYADLQAQLDSAIHIFLAAKGPTNGGPASEANNSELIYKDRNTSAAALRAVYTAVAHSLKARLYMHVAEASVAGVAGAPANAYALALAQVDSGITTPDDDFLWFHDRTPSGQNIWWQWNAFRGDLAPGAAFIEVEKRRIAAGVEDTSRMAFYFGSADGGPAATNNFGYRPTGSTGMVTNGTIYDGSGSPSGSFSFFNTFIDGGTPPGDFRQPEITFIETQLIGAEAALQTGQAALAQTFLNNARTNRQYGSTGGAKVSFGNAPGILTATLQNIIEEKYTALYLNPEVWNDYKRTCFPSLAPAPSAPLGTTPRSTPIPGRLPYGQSELNANPNAPQVSSTGQNANDPNPCPVLNYVNSSPLAN